MAWMMRGLLDNATPSRSALTARRRLRGSTAIEFALLFLPAFALFYGIVSYGFVFTLLETFNSAAEGGARAAIAVDPVGYEDDNDYMNNGVIPRVRLQVANQLGWLPDSIKSQVLGEGNQNVDVTYSDNVLTVVVGYQDYTSNPVIPLLHLPVIGTVPKLPARLVSTATARL
jgi:Flp pilus assembly protein TadG